MTKLNLGTLCVFSILTATLSAQTVTVNKAGTGNYTSVSDALGYFSVDPDAGVPNIIQVTDGAVYEETITIDAPVTLEAVGSSATLALLANPLGTGGKGGIVINLPGTITTGSVTIRNINIIPSTTTSANLLLTAIENINNNLLLTLDKCILSANSGTNTPYISDGWHNGVLKLIPTQPTYDAGIIQFGDDGIVLGGNTNGEYEGDGVELVFKDSVLTHFRRDYVVSTVKPYGIIMENVYGTDPNSYPALNRITRILGDSAVSFCDISLQLAGDVEIDNQSAPRILIRGSKNQSIEFTGIAPNFRKVEGIIIEGATFGIWDDGYGLVRPTISNSIVWQVLHNILIVKKPSTDVATGTLTIENCTMAGGRTNTSTNHAYRFEPLCQTDIVLRNSIIAGRANQPTNALNVFSLAGIHNVTVDGSAVVTEAPYGLRKTAPYSLGTSVTFIGSSSTPADPQFLNAETTNTAYPTNPGLLNVSSGAYADANSVGGPLGGGAQYVGPVADVSDWALYSAMKNDGSEERSTREIEAFHNQRLR